MAQDTSSDETTELGYDDQTEEDWLDDPEELPPRPRRKLLSPIPLALLAVLLLAGGFLAGVEVEKGQGNSASSAGGLAGLASLRSGRAGSGAPSAGRGAAGGFPGGGFAGAGGGLAGGLTTGEVTYVSGSTLYVTSFEGNTTKVKAPAGTKVSKTVSTSVHSIHPGDTVVVRGSQSGNGVTASSISVSPSGTGTGSSSSAIPSGSGGAGSTQQLFGGG